MGRTYPEVLYAQRNRLKRVVLIQQIAIAISVTGIVYLIIGR